MPRHSRPQGRAPGSVTRRRRGAVGKSPHSGVLLSHTHPTGLHSAWQILYQARLLQVQRPVVEVPRYSEGTWLPSQWLLFKDAI